MLNVIMLVVSLGLGFAFNYLFYSHALGVSWVVFVGLVLAGLGILCWRQKVRPPRLVWILLVPLLAFSSMVFVRASYFLTFLNIVFSLYLLLLIARIVHGDTLKRFVIVDYLSTFFIEPFTFIFGHFPRLLREVCSSRGPEGKRVFSSPVVKGIVMALPVVAVLTLLFASADLVFEKYLREIFSVEISVELLTQIFYIVFVTVLFGGAYAYIFSQQSERKSIFRDSTVGNVVCARFPRFFASSMLSFSCLLSFSFGIFSAALSGSQRKDLPTPNTRAKGFLSCWWLRVCHS